MATKLNARVKANWSATILVCAKCSKRLDGGFGKKQRQPLAKALRKQLGVKLFRKAPVGIVETKCLGICPRGAVVLVDARAPDRWHLVPAGADLAALAGDLGLVASPGPADRR
ncbi:MAG: hypothetical protein B7Y45_06910 [Sphingomonas sp. 28-66-16]|nr:MAG: hypothetical protein B7Y45_06910 [Sphingomonas sp. 28-66-16]